MPYATQEARHAWEEKNRGRINARNKEWARKNPEKIARYKQRYYLANKPKIQAYKRENYIRNKDAIRKDQHEYYLNNKDKFVVYGKRANEKYRKDRADAIRLLGGKCSECGFSDERALQFNHINGGGYGERKSGFSYTQFVAEVLSGIRSDINLLCANCNMIHARENGYI